LLGKGCFGEVHKVRLKPYDIDVACKILKDEPNSNVFKTYLNEIIAYNELRS